MVMRMAARIFGWVADRNTYFEKITIKCRHFYNGCEFFPTPLPQGTPRNVLHRTINSHPMKFFKIVNPSLLDDLQNTEN